MTDAPAIFPQPLHCRPAPGPAGDAEAWLLPGADAAAWLDEILRWQVPLAQVRLLPLPAALGDSAGCGVLVLSGEPPRVAPGRSALGYRRAAASVYVPCDATLSPPVSVDELRSRVVWPVAVFHPGLGLVGCRNEDLVEALTLLDAGPAGPLDWKQAVSAPAPRRGLDSVRPIAPATTEALLNEMGGDIASGSAASLPKLPQESPARRWLDRAKLGLSNAIGGIAGAAGKDSLVGKFGTWAQQQAAALAAGLDTARAAELARLLKLLEADPDEGLRFALPLADNAATRGLARPTGRLTRRNTDFTGAARTGAADAWKVRADVQQKLRERYRALAARELGLRRYRRAAYVFATLLGDFYSAANVLEQGGLWREAATLYQEKLNNNARAAACLEKGGLVHEAITIYLTLKQHEKIGDLYTLIGRPVDAAGAYRGAVDERLGRDDVVDAARLLETKLADPDAALAALTDGWPASKQASACLRGAYALLARRGLHEEARRRIDAVRADAARQTRSADQAVTLVDVLAGVAADYPADGPRDAAGDAVRLVAGHTLARADAAQARALLAAVERATRGDPLLSRDTARFLAARNAASPAARPRGTTLVRTFRIDLPDPPLAWTPVPGGFVALATSADPAFLTVCRATWEGLFQKIRFPVTQGGPTVYRLVVSGRHVRVFSVVETTTFPGTRLSAGFGFPEIEISSGGRWTGGTTLGVTATRDGNVAWFGRSSGAPGGTYAHFVCNANGQLLDTGDAIVVVPADAKAATLHLHAQGEVTLLTAGRTLFVFRRRVLVQTLALPDAAWCVSGDSVAPAAVRLAMGFEEGAALVWPMAGRIESFAVDMVRPVVHMVRDNLIVAVDRAHGRVYDVVEGRARLRPPAFTPDKGVIGILALPSDDQFATLAGDGRVSVYAIA